MKVIGYGGGGKGGDGGSSAVEQPDSLHNTTYAKVLDLISEGEIKGLVNGLQSVYFDNTPLQNPDGSYNFTVNSIDFRAGTQDQDFISGFPSVESEASVNFSLLYSTPFIRSFSNTQLSAVRITLSVSALSQTDKSNGNINPTSVRYSIELSTDGGAFIPYVDTAFSGKTTTKYSRTHRINLPRATSGWIIRVRRLDPDSTSSYLVNRISLDSYTEVIDAKLRYPMSALVGLQIDASQFTSIPTRSYDMYGRLIKVPTNYNPDTKTYTGAWDGTFKVAYSNNPAWVFYDIVTNDRYGIGERVTSSQIDKWSLYSIAQYCDEPVSDGINGTEPRFTCNCYITEKADAYKVLQDLASIFRGMAYWSSSQVYVTADRPSDPVYVFTAANVIDGKFERIGSPLKTRYNVALVTWNDPNNFYQQTVEAVQDQQGITDYGVQEVQITAFGCTSQAQAHRIGLWTLTTSRLETNTISFDIGLDSLNIVPGDIIRVADPARMGRRNAGRISSATYNSVVVDKAATINIGDSITVILPTGVSETKPVLTVSGNSVIINGNWSVIPQSDSVWSVDNIDLVAPTYKVLSLAEKDSITYTVSALQHEPGKFDYIEKNIQVQVNPNTINNVSSPEIPTGLTAVESLYLAAPSVVGNKITVSWTGNSPTYQLSYRNGVSNWTNVNVTNTSYDIAPAETGVYEFRVYGVNSLGVKSSSYTTISQEIYGKQLPPNDVENFNMAAISGAAHITFSPSIDLDVTVGGYLRIRYTSEITGQDWSNAVDIGPQVPGTASSVVLPLLSGSYLAKWVDSSGNESKNFVSISTTAPNIEQLNVVDTLQQDPTFSGIKSGVSVDSLGLILDSDTTIDGMLTNIDTWTLLSLIGGVSSNGTYYFDREVDLSDIQNCRITANISTTGFEASDLIDGRLYVDTWSSIDGDVITDVGCTIYIRQTNDDPTMSPVWSDWVPLVVGDYTARAFQFKAELTSNYSSHNINVLKLGVTVDMPDRTESGTDLDSGTSTYSVVYSKSFMQTPTVGITAQDMQTGDYYTLTSKTKDGFNIIFKNASGSAISRKFDYYAKGY